MMIELLVSLYCVGEREKKKWKWESLARRLAKCCLILFVLWETLHFLRWCKTRVWLSSLEMKLTLWESDQWRHLFSRSLWHQQWEKETAESERAMWSETRHQIRCTDYWRCLRQHSWNGSESARWGCERIIIEDVNEDAFIECEEVRLLSHVSTFWWNVSHEASGQYLNGDPYCSIPQKQCISLSLSLCSSHSFGTVSSFKSDWAIFTWTCDNLHLEC